MVAKNTTACQASRSAPWCGSSELLSRSYEVRARWPFDAFHLVTEFAPGTCDLYSYKARWFCCQLTTRKSSEPERHVTQAIASFLAHCLRRTCRSLDLGANNGWMSSLMLQLGSHVLSVEPAPDFARAIRETAALNCWQARAVVMNGRACAAAAGPGCLAPEQQFRCDGNGWRWGNTNGPSQNAVKYGSQCSTVHGLPTEVMGWPLSQLIHQATGPGAVLDLIKMDADGAHVLAG
jgi:FkbM family methyltransferase